MRCMTKEGLIKSVRGECFPFAPSIHRASATLGTNGKYIEPWRSDLIRLSLRSLLFASMFLLGVGVRVYGSMAGLLCHHCLGFN